MTLTIQNAVLDGQPATLTIDDGLISAIENGNPPDAGAGRGDVLDAAGMTVVAGLVNGHGHAAMTLFRSFGDDLPLMEWLETKIWPAEANLTAEDVYWGTRLACVEMIRTGTTKFFDMYWHGTAVARAAIDAGVRVVPSAVLIDAHDVGQAADLRKNASESLDELLALAASSNLVTPSLGPHAIYTVSSDSLRWVGEKAREVDVPVHIHLSETEFEVTSCQDTHGTTPAMLLDNLDVLGPKTLLAHGNWLTDEEFALIAERGSTIVTNPASNMKLANGRIFPYPKAEAAGCAVGLGTDGVASNNNLDLFEEMKIFALVQKHDAVDPSVAPAADVLAIAQGRRSPLMGGSELEVGAPADLMLVRSDDSMLLPGDLTANLVYSANGHSVDTTVIAGEVVMRHGQVADETEIRAEVRARLPRLLA